MTVRLDSENVLERLLEEEMAILYKHSTRCPTSSQAKHHVIRLIKKYPELPVYIVDVLADRKISQEASRRTDVRHESPQVIVLREGKVVWYASHYGVRRSAIEKALGLE